MTHGISRIWTVLRTWFHRSASAENAAPADSVVQLKPDAEYILSRLSPWTLACAVGAMNGSLYGSVGACGRVDFDIWTRLVNKDKWPVTGASEKKVIAALREFAERHRSEHMNAVLHEEERRRGMLASLVLGPGESVAVRVSLGPAALSKSLNPKGQDGPTKKEIYGDGPQVDRQ